jgi:hypothetical protein
MSKKYLFPAIVAGVIGPHKSPDQLKNFACLILSLPWKRGSPLFPNKTTVAQLLNMIDARYAANHLFFSKLSQSLEIEMP